jgi:hypothetical protein
VLSVVNYQFFQKRLKEGSSKFEFEFEFEDEFEDEDEDEVKRKLPLLRGEGRGGERKIRRSAGQKIIRSADQLYAGIDKGRLPAPRAKSRGAKSRGAKSK